MPLWLQLGPVLPELVTRWSSDTPHPSRGPPKLGQANPFHRKPGPAWKQGTGWLGDRPTGGPSRKAPRGTACPRPPGPAASGPLLLPSLHSSSGLELLP